MKGGDQCDTRNFVAPVARQLLRDTLDDRLDAVLREDRRSPRTGHARRHAGWLQGRARRPRRRTARAMRVVAVEDGVISNVGSYSVSLRADSGGRIYRYLHLNMSKLKVATNQTVKKGDVIGYVSNDFGGTPTTLHLHFEIKLNTTETWLAVRPALLAHCSKPTSAARETRANRSRTTSWSPRRRTRRPGCRSSLIPRGVSG